VQESNLLAKDDRVSVKSKGAGRQPPPASNWGAILDIRWLLYYLAMICRLNVHLFDEHGSDF
jgi:hypothetical protein